MNDQELREACVRAAGEQLGADVVISLDGLTCEEIKFVAEHSMWAMLANLFEVSLLQATDGRVAGAWAFSIVVQHQQTLMTMLEEKYGISLQVDGANQVIDAMSKQDAFHLGHHDVLMLEIRAIQLAKSEGRLATYADESKARIRGILANLMARRKGIPIPDRGWMPEVEPLKNQDDAWMYVWGNVADGQDDTIPVLARVAVGNVSYKS